MNFAAFLFDILAFTLLCSTLGRLYKRGEKDALVIIFAVVATLFTLVAAIATWLPAHH